MVQYFKYANYFQKNNIERKYTKNTCIEHIKIHFELFIISRIMELRSIIY